MQLSGKHIIAWEWETIFQFFSRLSPKALPPKKTPKKQTKTIGDTQRSHRAHICVSFIDR